jgi:hypothetical protein
MNRKEQALVMGFVEYLQGVYGEGGTLAESFITPPNSLLIPMFVGGDEEAQEMMPDFGAVGSVMGGGDLNQLLAQIDAVPPSPMGAPGMGMGMPGMGAPGMGMPAGGMGAPPMMDPMMMGMMG